MDLAKHTRLQILGCILLASLALTMASTPPSINDDDGNDDDGYTPPAPTPTDPKYPAPVPPTKPTPSVPNPAPGGDDDKDDGKDDDDKGHDDKDDGKDDNDKGHDDKDDGKGDDDKDDDDKGDDDKDDGKDDNDKGDKDDHKPSPPIMPTPPLTPTPPGSTPATPTPYVPTPTPPSESETGAGVKRARCKKKDSPCYGVEYTCPTSCPRSCEVDCVTCKALCKCDKPGSVCQDPRFIGGDGLTFYFHGKKDYNFCLISDPNLHINAHFIGKRRSGMARDFTWVQSIAILFDTHRLYIGALKTSMWDDSVDRISASFDGNVITIPQLDGATWTSSPGVYPRVLIKRVNADTNNVEVVVEGLLKITARVVPITMEDSRIHGYDVKEDDCLAHLDLGFKFQDLSDNVDGVLGQTYRSNYVSRVKIGVRMPVMGGDREFQTTGLFASDCLAARFTGKGGSNGGQSKMELPEMNCASGLGGKGVVCKR